MEAGPIVAEVFDDPNNTLAVEYLKSMKFLNLDFEVLPVKRKGPLHDSDETSGEFAGGSKLRQMIEDDEDIAGFAPLETAEAIKEYEEAERLCYFDNLERELLYMLRKSSPRDIAALPDVGQGLENRIFEAGKNASTLDDFFDMVKTKRYTMARIRRILMNMYIGTLNSDLLMPPSHGRILAFNDRGVDIIKASKEKNADGKNKLAVPFSTDIKELFEIPTSAAKRFIQLTTVSSDLYALAARNVVRSGTDFTAKIGKLTTIEVAAPKETPVSDEEENGVIEVIADAPAQASAEAAPAEVAAVESMIAEDTAAPQIEVTKGGQSPE
jgi:hypothetical protein